MAKKLTGEKMTRIGQALKQEEFDPAPILSVKSMDGTGSIVSGQGPTKKILFDDDEIEEDGVDSDIEDDEPEVDPFEPVIKKLMTGQSPVVRSAIEGTPCFAKVWYSHDDKDYCPEVECGLRKLCEVAYHQAIESVEAVVEASDEMEGVRDSDVEKLIKFAKGKPEEKLEDDLTKVSSKRKLQSKKKGRKVKVKKEPGDPSKKKERRPYVDQGRTVDELAKLLSNGLQPQELPDNWSYHTVGTKEEREKAAKMFQDKFGGNLCHSMRAGYHVYFYDGIHCLRFWVNAAGGGYLDMNPHLAEEIVKMQLGFTVEVTPVKNPRHRYNFFPKRIKIKTTMQMEAVIQAVRASLSKMVVQ